MCWEYRGGEENVGGEVRGVGRGCVDFERDFWILSELGVIGDFEYSFITF